jgi:hypothetical protein
MADPVFAIATAQHLQSTRLYRHKGLANIPDIVRHTRVRGRKTTADPSTPFAAKGAANSAQDDIAFLCRDFWRQ